MQVLPKLHFSKLQIEVSALNVYSLVFANGKRPKIVSFLVLALLLLHLKEE
jgi:hypothetical protein